MTQHELVPNPPPHLEDKPLLRVTYAMSQVNERGRRRMRRIRVTYPRLVGTHCDILKSMGKYIALEYISSVVSW